MGRRRGGSPPRSACSRSPSGTRKPERLSLVRDQLGIKPLYVYAKGGVVAFGSELKAAPRWRPTSTRRSIASRSRRICAICTCRRPGRSFATSSSCLPAISCTSPIRRSPCQRPRCTGPRRTRRAVDSPNVFTGSDAEAIEQLDALLGDAVSRQMQSDVPLGALLSGGVDSSVVVALMQKASTRPAETFSIGFDHPEYNEAPFAAGVAEHLRHEPHATDRHRRDALDSGAAPCRRCSTNRSPIRRRSRRSSCASWRAARSPSRSRATAATSCSAATIGMCAANASSDWSGARQAPARRLLAGAVRSLPPSALDTIAGGVATMLPPRLRVRRPGDKVDSFGALLDAIECDRALSLDGVGVADPGNRRARRDRTVGQVRASARRRCRNVSSSG